MCLIVFLMLIALIAVSIFWRQILLGLLVIGLIILIIYLLRRSRFR